MIGSLMIMGLRKICFQGFSPSTWVYHSNWTKSRKQGHHPELFNVYNKLSIRLSTHDAND
jgi:4a-hydroxytetrahydrobiopterin dehydratase